MEVANLHLKDAIKQCLELEGNNGVAFPGAWADRSDQFLLSVMEGLCFPSLFVYSLHRGCVLCLVLSLFT